jgi:hypothetical protein
MDDLAKLKCVEREVKLRRGFYPRWVAAGRMTQDEADTELQTMEAIADDYKERLGGNLFTFNAAKR